MGISLRFDLQEYCDPESSKTQVTTPSYWDLKVADHSEIVSKAENDGDNVLVAKSMGAHNLNFDIEALPEGCLAITLSLTSPRDACRMELVGWNFRSAAQSDAVWERFLPEDYKEIVSRSVEKGGEGKTKKEIYLHLCDHPVLIDGGSKSFSLEKRSGKKLFMLGAADLSICCDLSCNWGWFSIPESRFLEVAKLKNRSLLEVRGHIKTSMLSPNTTYSAFLVFKTTTTPPARGRLDAKGSFGITGQENQTRSVCLDLDFPNNDGYKSFPISTRTGLSKRHSGNPMRIEEPSFCFDGSVEYPEQRDNVWNEVLLGEFDVNEGQDCELEVSLVETETAIWLTGLIIEGIEIRPKEESYTA